MNNPEPLKEIITYLGKLPGLGEKSAERIAFYLLKAPKEYLESLRHILQSLKEIKYCSVCFNLAPDDGLCSICRNQYRDKSVVCVVEEISDLWALEQTGAYKGLYHILGGRIAPLDGVGPENLTLKPLFNRLKNGRIKEVILATGYTMEGDSTATYIQDRLNGLKIRITRIARGIPAGSRLSLTSRPILADALRERKVIYPTPSISGSQRNPTVTNKPCTNLMREKSTVSDDRDGVHPS